MPAIQGKELWLWSGLCCHIASAWLPVSCLMPLLLPLSIWVDWTRVSHCGVSGLLVLLHFWAFCQGMELFWSLLGRMITARSPTHALDLLLFPWDDIATISKKHCFLRKIVIQFFFLKKKKKLSLLEVGIWMNVAFILVHVVWVVSKVYPAVFQKEPQSSLKHGFLCLSGEYIYFYPNGALLLRFSNSAGKVREHNINPF